MFCQETRLKLRRAIQGIADHIESSDDFAHIQSYEKKGARDPLEASSKKPDKGVEDQDSIPCSSSGAPASS